MTWLAYSAGWRFAGNGLVSREQARERAILSHDTECFLAGFDDRRYEQLAAEAGHADFAASR